MNTKRFVLSGIGLGVLLGLAACGGGSSSPDSATLPASVTSGPITAFGSIYVNGEEINTDKASVYIEGKHASESDLRVGMMVNVLQDSNGDAKEIRFADDIEAVVFENNIPAGEKTGTLNVMGYTVTVDTDTIFESKVSGITDVSMIAKGNIVEVSGYATGKGEVTATRIEVIASDLTDYLNTHSDSMEVKGIVSNHDATNETFDLGPITVNYSGGAELDDLPDGISDGMYVEVKSTEGFNTDNQLVASKVELEHKGYDDHHGDDYDEYKLAGKIAAVSDDSITVNDKEIIITEDTEFDHGSKDDLKVGAMVKVEGKYNDSDQLVAKEIEFKAIKSMGNVKHEGIIAAVDAEDTNIGKITLEDKTVILVNNNTIMKDDRHLGMERDHHFNLKDLAQGDYIEAYTYSNDDATYTARKIEREDSE